MIQPKLTVTVTKTTNGDADYVQIISDDQFGVNVVLIADEIEVKDMRKPSPKKRGLKR